MWWYKDSVFTWGSEEQKNNESETRQWCEIHKLKLGFLLVGYGVCYVMISNTSSATVLVNE